MSAVARTRRTSKSDVATASQYTCLSRRDPYEPFHRGLVSTPDARRLRGRRGPRSGRNAFTAAWVMQVSFDPLLLTLSINPHHSSYRLLKEGRAFSVNVLKKGQLDLAEHYGRPARADKLAGTEWTTDRTGLPLLREALAWFECEFINEHPAGDHVLVLGKVIVASCWIPKPSPCPTAKLAQWTVPLRYFPDAFVD